MQVHLATESRQTNARVEGVVRKVEERKIAREEKSPGSSDKGSAKRGFIRQLVKQKSSAVCSNDGKGEWQLDVWLEEDF